MWLARFSPAIHMCVSVIILGCRRTELTSDRRSGVGFTRRGRRRRGRERRAERQDGDDREDELSVEAEEHCVTVEYGGGAVSSDALPLYNIRRFISLGPDA